MLVKIQISSLMLGSRLFLKLLWHLFVFVTLLMCAWHHKILLYLGAQAKGQWQVITGSVSVKEYVRSTKLTELQRQNLRIIDRVKQFSVDSLGYLPTHNFERVYDQNHQPLLWVVTACKPYAFEAREWQFPIVGRVTYKGFFERYEALKEMSALRSMGYDVEIRTVSAWSTLGWLHDPLLSENLNMKHGDFCNLLFHELFHASVYASDAVNQNENLAMFIADKATRIFLSRDTLALNDYVTGEREDSVFTAYMLKGYRFLNNHYQNMPSTAKKQSLKCQAYIKLLDSLKALPIRNKRRLKAKEEAILRAQNAVFVDYAQYHSLQDSLDKVFNIIYKGKLKKMVRDLTHNASNY